MKLRLYMVNILAGPTILQTFDLPKQNIEDYYLSKDFALFSSYKDLNYWEEFFEKKNGNFSYVIVELTENAENNTIRSFFDIKMEKSEELIKLFQNFQKETQEEVFVVDEEKLDFILDKISTHGMDSLDSEEKKFLQNYKQ